ncbi:MAG: ssl1498 family light-harvesting-like protein, partial [Okeania sp. SIO2H7]|nr:ssl1498 family light-harvesting-like protein [Okeania sp. SIO2H7]
MITQQLDNGILNIYATETESYSAVPPSPEQRKAYALQGGIAILLISTLMAI